MVRRAWGVKGRPPHGRLALPGVLVENDSMTTSVQYITNQKGQKTAVVLPIPDYERLLEDLDDLAAIADRHDEPAIPHDRFQAELKRDGLLSR
jgi:hypothetical protein